jgi:hypothetical protein
MSERPDLSDEALSHQLHTELPRYGAPAHLRAAILVDSSRPRRAAWLIPSLAALAAAALILLFLLPMLAASNRPDPVQQLVRAVVSEHSRAVMWGTRSSTFLPASSSWLTQESGIALARVFAGDDALSLIGAEPVYLLRERGVALHYRDRADHLLTYVALPAPNLQLPERYRLAVANWRPVLVQDGGFAVWVWKHGDLVCFLVSDMGGGDEIDRFKDYFVRVRTATEPLLAY